MQDQMLLGDGLYVKLSEQGSVVVTHSETGKSMYLKSQPLINLAIFAIAHATLSWSDVVALSVWGAGEHSRAPGATALPIDIMDALGDRSSGPRGACLHIEALPHPWRLISLYHDKTRDPGSFVFWQAPVGGSWIEFEKYDNLISASLRLMELTKVIEKGLR